jgi:hypothetical protein
MQKQHKTLKPTDCFEANGALPRPIRCRATSAAVDPSHTPRTADVSAPDRAKSCRQEAPMAATIDASSRFSMRVKPFDVEQSIALQRNASKPVVAIFGSRRCSLPGRSFNRNPPRTKPRAAERHCLTNGAGVISCAATLRGRNGDWRRQPRLVEPHLRIRRARWPD